MHWLRYWLNIIAIVVGTLVYSAVLFRITQPGPGSVMKNTATSDVTGLTPLLLLVLLETAYVEEMLFRLGIQNYLGAKLINKRYGYALAIVLTAAALVVGAPRHA